jgi:hypothetical protein
MARGKTSPSIVKRDRCGTIGGNVPHRATGKFLQAEIGARLEFSDRQMLLDQGDEWQKELAIETMLVELPGRNI